MNIYSTMENHDITNSNNNENSGSTFLYFGYGSNLLRERIHLRNPSAVFVDIAELKGHRLCFSLEKGQLSARWHGCVASIERSQQDSVWGVVWRLNTEDLPHLDEQEDEGDLYRRSKITVKTPQGESLECWTYCLLDFREGIPSPQYIGVIRRGAEQNRLPEKYCRWLDTIPDNGYDGELVVMNNINKMLTGDEETFLYFAYGSNLLKARIHIHNPTARFVGPARLEGHKLCFRPYPGWNQQDNYWRGAPASIDESDDGHVWGAVWRLQKSQIANLDRQESVYRSVDITARSPEGVEYVCRTYQMREDMGYKLPSPHYMKVVVAGATESGIPKSYVEFLKSLPHNEDTTPPSFLESLLNPSEH